MTVYVDDMKAEFTPRHAPGRKYVMCHMIADNMDELHRMAQRIGVARRWFQGDHYDITQTKRAVAVKHGAVEITWRQAGMMMANKRAGYRLGKPEDAEAVAMMRRRKMRAR